MYHHYQKLGIFTLFLSKQLKLSKTLASQFSSQMQQAKQK